METCNSSLGGDWLDLRKRVLKTLIERRSQRSLSNSVLKFSKVLVPGVTESILQLLRWKFSGNLSDHDSSRITVTRKRTGISSEIDVEIGSLYCDSSAEGTLEKSVVHPISPTQSTVASMLSSQVVRGSSKTTRSSKEDCIIDRSKSDQSIAPGNNDRIEFGISPNELEQFFKKFDTPLACDSSKDYDESPTILCGDFNLDIKHAVHKKDSLTYMQRNFHLDLLNKNEESTTYGKSCIDLVFVRNIANAEYLANISYFSYHRPIFVLLDKILLQ